MQRDTINATRARIACISSTQEAFEHLAEALCEAGFDCVEPEGGAAGAFASDLISTDLCLVDLRGQRVSAAKAKNLASLLRHGAPEASLFFLIDPSLDASVRAALRRLGEVVPAGDNYSHLIERCRQMLRLRNVAEETGERLKSLASMNRVADFPSIATSSEPINVLIAGAPGPGASVAIHAASRVAGRCVCVLTAGQAMRALEAEDFDAAVFVLPHDDITALSSISGTIRRDRRFAGLPVIHMAEKVSGFSKAMKFGANDVVLRAHAADDLGVKIQVAARRYRLLRSMRRFLRACDGAGVCDHVSDAFSAQFLGEHGARLCVRADQTGRPLAAALITLRPGADAALGRNALTKAAGLIKRVTRAEDVTARVGADSFVVCLPATIADDAANIARRIDGVLSGTALHTDNNQMPFSATVETAVRQRETGQAIEEVIAHLIKNRQPAFKPPLQQSLR